MSFRDSRAGFQNAVAEGPEGAQACLLLARPSLALPGATQHGFLTLATPFSRFLPPPNTVPTLQSPVSSGTAAPSGFEETCV